LACGYPPIAGIFTAVVGGLLSPWISNSELTIKGPAAGLIVIAIGCISEFGGTGFADGTWSLADQQAYEIALAVGVAAASAQIVFGLVRGGILGEFFPSTAVHGMLAAIGLIIIAKQLPVTLGVSATGAPLELLAKIPDEFMHMNPAVGLIGLISLAVMFGWPLIKHRVVRKIPAPMVVLIIAVPLGLYFELDSPVPHTHVFHGQVYQLSNKFLVNVPDNMFAALSFPDFSGLANPRAWYWAMMFAVIGTLESMLSAKAVELIDPWKRKTNLDGDNTAVGAGNLVASMIGGLPMISEIVRSRANIDNGARTRFANMFHGFLLLVFVASVPGLISMIPLSALGAMLVYTGFRLAHPREFLSVYRMGPEQLIVFCSTILAVLATDLLEGIAIGIGIKLLLHVLNGVPVSAFFRPTIRQEDNGEQSTLELRHAAVFSNWIGVKKRIERCAHREVIIDLSQTRFVDHTVMEKLHGLQAEFRRAGRALVIAGLQRHRPLSKHPQAARKRPHDVAR
jgi:MFS superfamily sulfate permease-like transporter